MAELKRITVKGYKSIQSLDLEMGRLNVLIGVNGSGKSNLVSIFQMLNMMMTGNLQLFVQRAGGANAILHYGVKNTIQIEIALEFESEEATDLYEIKLVHGAPDTLIFTQEQITFSKKNHQGTPYVDTLGSGHKESALDRQAVASNQTRAVIRSILSRCRMFQFHDTSQEAYIRQKCRVDDNWFLKHNAGNLAAMLYRLQQSAQQSDRDSYSQIVSTVRSVFPRFHDFQLEPDSVNSSYMMLNWREVNSAEIFGPHQLSDGTLRAMALTTLLCLPDEALPSVIVIDEPELGLHPAATEIIADVVRQASTRAQIILATQSMRLVNSFRPEDVDLIVCERDDGPSDIRRRSPIETDGWTDEYTLGEVWESRAIGGWL